MFLPSLQYMKTLEWSKETGVFARERAAEVVAVATEIALRIAQLFAPEIELWMKDNAPWDDVTGAARDGLRAEVERVAYSQAIVLTISYNNVTYGKWLELKYQGRHAILQPTLHHWSPRLFEAVKQAVQDAGRGKR